MGHVEEAVQVGRDHLVPLLAGHAVEHAVPGDAGIVDQDLDRPQIGLDLGDALDAGVVIGDRPFVDRDAGLGLERGRRLVIARIVGGDLISFGLQRLGNRLANSPAAAGYQGYTSHVHFLS